MRKVRTYLKVRKAEPEVGAEAAAASWTVPEIVALYGWPPGTAPGGGTIGIVELSGGFRASDVSLYFAGIGQPVPEVEVVSLGGVTNSPGTNEDEDIEVALDIQFAGASYFKACGKPARMIVYFSATIEEAVSRAAEDGCAVVSISWGADEAEWGPAGCAAMEAAAAAANSAGTVVIAAAGDNDSSDGGPNPANVDVPAACPSVIGIGGTSTPRTGPATVWNDDPGSATGEGTGGGYSRHFVPWPAWQASADPAPPLPPKGRGRLVPDLAVNADPETGYSAVVSGRLLEGIGGTSCGAPIVAGLVAAFGPLRLGDWGPELWAHPEAFVLVLKGGNGAYEAGPCPSPCTGLGTPIGSRLLSIVLPGR
jgi:kumamolisin